jgi:FAD/FMN-containing dehydrogenase
MRNWGRNLAFNPRRHLRPTAELEVLDALDRHRRRTIRVLGSLHSWSDVATTDDVVLSLRRLGRAARVVEGPTGAFTVTVSAGSRIGEVLEVLARHDPPLTLPTVGAIKRQTIAGAISTATHGSGASSLSHYVRALRIAHYTAAGMAVVRDIGTGPELLAARCGLGCLGVVVAVSIECVPAYDVEETLETTASPDDVLDRAKEVAYPLQQFVLVPFAWTYYVLRRRVDRQARPGRVRWWLCTRAYRAYKLVAVDFFVHLIVKVLAWVSLGSLTRGFLHVLSRTVLGGPRLVLGVFRIAWPRGTFSDASEHILTLRHDLWRHVEMEVFVPARHVRQALDLARYVTDTFAGRLSGAPIDAELRLSVDQTMSRARPYTHHYPITCRLVERDEALVSMTAGVAAPGAADGDGRYYTLSFFNYGRRRARFTAYCTVLARALIDRYQARLHWGKFIPPECRELLRKTYSPSAFSEFERICAAHDPAGTFRNRYAKEVLGLP